MLALPPSPFRPSVTILTRASAIAGGLAAAGSVCADLPENRCGRRSLVGPPRRAATGFAGPSLRYGPIPRVTRAGPLRVRPASLGGPNGRISPSTPLSGIQVLFFERGTSTCANTIRSTARHSERGFIRRSAKAVSVGVRSSFRGTFAPVFLCRPEYDRAGRPSPRSVSHFISRRKSRFISHFISRSIFESKVPVRKRQCYRPRHSLEGGQGACRC